MCEGMSYLAGGAEAREVRVVTRRSLNLTLNLRLVIPPMADVSSSVDSSREEPPLCMACCEPLSSANHLPQAFDTSQCLATAITAQLSSGSFKNPTCPSCDRSLENQDLQESADLVVFRRWTVHVP